MKRVLFLSTLIICNISFGQTTCDSLFTLANKTYQTQGARAAIDIFTRIIQSKCNKLSRAYNNRGYMYNEIEDYKSAITDFDMALKIDSLNHQAYANASTSYNRLNDAATATAYINKAIELSPENAQYYRLRGDVKFTEKKFDSSILDYKKSIAINPDYLALYIIIARAYEAKSRAFMNDAQANLNGTAQQSRDNLIISASEFYANRDSAEAILTLLMVRFPQNKQLVFNRAEFYRRNFLYDKAIADYTKGLSDNGPDFEFLCNLGRCYDGIGKADSAVKYYTQSIDQKPNVFAFVNRGMSLKKMNKLKKAIADELQAIQLDSTFAQAYLIIGNCYLEMKQPDKALTYYEKGLAQNPEGEIKDLLKFQLANVKK